MCYKAAKSFVEPGFSGSRGFSEITVPSKRKFTVKQALQEFSVLILVYTTNEG